MITIGILDPIVLQTMQQTFPRSKVNLLLARYIKLLENVLDDAILQCRLVKHTSHKNQFLYQIYLDDIWKKCPQIGGKQIRVHAWLEDNNLKLIKSLETADKFKIVEISLIATTSLVKVIDIDPRENPKGAFEKMHPNFDKVTLQQINIDYDYFEVDLASLEQYIMSLQLSGSVNSYYNRKQSMYVSAVSQYKPPHLNSTKNIFYQKKKISQFGRTYYDGISIQNIRKSTRAAMLGDSYEYDMKSSVVAWKLGYARCYIDKIKKIKNSSVQSIFPMCYQYWDDKSVLIDKIKVQVFLANTYVDLDEQTVLIKSALTALNFGAKLSTAAYKDEDKKERYPAIKKIIIDNEESNRFINTPEVKDFVKEQNKLNNIIHEIETAKDPSLITKDFLLSKTGKMNKLKLYAYLYQHEETRVMDIFRHHAKNNNQIILANVHDAIILKDRLSNSLFRQITNDIHSISGNTYWFLNETQHHRVT